MQKLFVLGLLVSFMVSMANASPKSECIDNGNRWVWDRGLNKWRCLSDVQFKKAQSSAEKCEKIVSAAWYGKYSEVKSLLEAGVSPNCVAQGDKTALMAAARYGRQYDYDGNINIVKLLVKAGADVHVKDNDGNTAAIYAARMAHKKTAAYLVSVGANSEDVEKANRQADKDLAAGMAVTGLIVKGIGSVVGSLKEAAASGAQYQSSSSGSKTFECTYRCRTDGFMGFDKSDYSTTVQANTNYQAEEIVEKRANEQCKKLHMWSTSIRCE